LTITQDVADASVGGVIYYFCHIHSKMSGKIIIEDYEGDDEEQDLYSPVMNDSFDTGCGTSGTSEYRSGGEEDCGVSFFGGSLDTNFEQCLQAIDCQMFSEMNSETTADENDAIVTFMQQMIPHHINAVNMAKLILKETTQEELDAVEDFEDILYTIINVQNFQIHQFRNYLNPLDKYLGGGGGDEEAPPALPALCFSGESLVNVENRGVVKMSDLAIGDKVLVGDNEFEAVYSFGHKNDSAFAEYLQITTESNAKSLEISPAHMILVDNHYVPASNVKQGDMLQLASGDLVAVKNIKTVTRKGAYAPFTNSGKIIVNNIVASNYISYQGSEYLMVGDMETPLSYQWIAHTFNSAHRLAVMMGFKTETYTEAGVSNWVDQPHKTFEWVVEKNMFVASALIFSSLAIFGALSFLEFVLTNQSVMYGLMLFTFIAYKKVGKKNI